MSNVLIGTGIAGLVIFGALQLGGTIAYQTWFLLVYILGGIAILYVGLRWWQKLQHKSNFGKGRKIDRIAVTTAIPLFIRHRLEFWGEHITVKSASTSFARKGPEEPDEKVLDVEVENKDGELNSYILPLDRGSQVILEGDVGSYYNKPILFESIKINRFVSKYQRDIRGEIIDSYKEIAQRDPDYAQKLLDQKFNRVLQQEDKSEEIKKE